jgi:PAS domain S-box-containing protein
MSQSHEFLAGGGTVVALMRTHDWSTSPLGRPDCWPQSLRTVVSLMLQSSFPMFVAWGKDLGFLYNDPYAEILGTKHPHALGRRFYDIWSEIWSDISPLIDAAMAGQATYREDLPLLMNRKGYDEQTWFTFSYSPVRDESGQVAGMFCACTETTQKVLAHRGLRDLNETLERRVNEALAERKILADIVEGTDAFVQVADLEYRWLAINRAAADEFERIFGVRPTVGANMLSLLADQPQHRDAVQGAWSRALGGEEFTQIEEFGDPSRDRRAYEMRFNTLRGPDGNRIGAYQFVYDVTDRLRDQERLRTAEAALRQTQKMESLGQLTGGVAHDFNNLLAVFASGVQLLERTAGQAAPKPRVFEAMRRAIARGTGLTRHLLAFSRRRPVNPEAIDVVAHLKGMRTMLDGSLGGHIEVRMEFGPDVWPVEVDAGEMELAILNLCLNARDAMPGGGTITIAAENAYDTKDSTDVDLVRITVTDTGQGMTPEIKARAFEPFFTTKDISKGSGLGLPQVYGFAQQSAGDLTLDSEVGVGTKVTLLLPRSQRDPIAKPEVPGAPLRGDGERRGHVLLVEDDREVSALTRELLGSLGFTVTHVTGAEAALGALANSRHIDIVLSDIMMPGGVSGLQLAREIRRRHATLPIVLTTGYVESVADMKDGEFTLLLKPFSVEALAEAFGVEATQDVR